MSNSLSRPNCGLAAGQPFLRVLLLLLLGAAPEVWADGSVVWKPGTLIQSEYQELAGTVILGAPTGPVFRAEGREYLLVLQGPASEVPGLKNRTALIMKGISGTLALPGQPVQYLFWPIECRIRNHTIPMPDPSVSHWQWLRALEKGS